MGEGNYPNPYFRGCSLAPAFWPEPGTVVPKVTKTRRRTMAEPMRTRPMRNNPIVSGRFDSEARIICTPGIEHTMSQMSCFCN